MEALDIIENGDAGCHANDGPDAHMIAAIALDEPGTEGTEEEESGGKDTHGQSHLEGREVLLLSQPDRQRGNEHIHRHRQEHVADGQQPEVAVPETDVNRGVLRIHQSLSLFSGCKGTDFFAILLLMQ